MPLVQVPPTPRRNIDAELVHSDPAGGAGTCWETAYRNEMPMNLSDNGLSLISKEDT